MEGPRLSPWVWKKVRGRVALCDSTFPVCSCILLSLRSSSLQPPSCTAGDQSTLLSSSSPGTERVSDQLRMAEGSPRVQRGERAKRPQPPNQRRAQGFPRRGQDAEVLPAKGGPGRRAERVERPGQARSPRECTKAGFVGEAGGADRESHRLSYTLVVQSVLFMNYSLFRRVWL